MMFMRSFGILYLYVCACFSSYAIVPPKFTPEVSTYGWKEIPNTSLYSVCPENNFGDFNYDFKFNCKNVTQAWSSASYDTKRHRLYFWGGGHHDYYGNELYALDFKNSKFLRLTDPAKPSNKDLAPQSELYPHDGTQPNGRHTYDGFTYSPDADKIWAFSGSLSSGSGAPDNVTWIFDPITNSWQRDKPIGDLPDGSIGVISAYDPVTKLIYLHNRKGLYSYQFTNSGGIYTLLNSQGYMGVELNAEIDHVNRKFVIIGKNSLISYDLSENSGYLRTDHELKGQADFIRNSKAPGFAFNSTDQHFYAWAGGNKIYKASYEDFTWQEFVFKDGPDSYFKQGTYGRFAYLENENAFALYNDVKSNAYVFRFPSVEDTQAPTKPSQLLIKSALPNANHLSWELSDDDFGVASYKVYVGEDLIAEVDKNEYKHFIDKLPKSFKYKVQAIDSSGNASEFSTELEFNKDDSSALSRLGNCDDEILLKEREDVIFCEPWESSTWWKEHMYLSDASILNAKPVTSSQIANTEITNEGCLVGNCLKVNLKKGEQNALSAFWPLSQANIAPQNVFLRYHIKLSEDWNGDMCNASGDTVGFGGKFPGLADIRSSSDTVGQCGNGGYSGDGLNCWSHRTVFGSCTNSDSTCQTKANAATRFGSYVYHANQNGSTGDAGYWDNINWGQSGRTRGICESNSNNMDCGKADYGVFERNIWYQVELQVMMNDVGKENGIIRGWIDGQLSFEKTNLVFRKQGHDLLHNRLVWLNVFKGGLYGNCEDHSILLDQMVISTVKPPGGLTEPTLSPPSVSLTSDGLNIELEQALNVNWQSEYASSCTASGLWQGEQLTEGALTVSNLNHSGYLTLTCINSSGTSSASIPVIVAGMPLPTVFDNNGVLAPTNLAASLTNEHSVFLDWDAAPGANVVGYNVYLNESLIGQTTDTTYTHQGLPSGITANYFMKAYDSDGNLSNSSEVATVKIPSDNANEVRFFPSSDTYLALSTFKTLGDQPTLDVSKSRNVLIRFPVELLDGERTLSKAKLVLNSIAEFGVVTVKVYALTKQWNELVVSRDFADKSQDIKWQHQNGDWIDSLGIGQGEKAYAALTLQDDDKPNSVEIDVTQLVSEWQSGKVVNHGLIIVGDNNSQRFHSKESGDVSKWPSLVLEFTKED